MSTITADPVLLSALKQMNDVTEIRDADGNVVGVFAPRITEESYLVEKVKGLVDFAELERRKKEEHGKGITTAELLKKLEALESST